MGNRNIILGFLIALLGSVLFVGMMEAIKKDSKCKYIIIQNDNYYKTQKIDSMSKEVIYFKDLNGNGISIIGNYVVREVK